MEMGGQPFFDRRHLAIWHVRRGLEVAKQRCRFIGRDRGSGVLRHLLGKKEAKLRTG